MVWAQNTYFINGPLPAHTFTRDEIDTLKYEKSCQGIKINPSANKTVVREQP